MTVENISWSISPKECCRPRRGRTRDLLVSSRAAHPTELPRPVNMFGPHKDPIKHEIEILKEAGHSISHKSWFTDWSAPTLSATWRRCESWLPIESPAKTDNTVRISREHLCIPTFTARINAVSLTIEKAHLRECTGWSESSLGAFVQKSLRLTYTNRILETRKLKSIYTKTKLGMFRQTDRTGPKNK